MFELDWDNLVLNVVDRRQRHMCRIDSLKDAAKIGFDDEFIYEEIDRKIEDRHKPMIALMRDEALGAFRMWEENAAKTEY